MSLLLGPWPESSALGAGCGSRAKLPAVGGFSGKLARVWLAGVIPLAMGRREKRHFPECLGNGKGKNGQKTVCGGD